MYIKTKFSIEEKVIFFHKEEGRIYEVKINSILINKYGKISYYIEDKASFFGKVREHPVPEKYLFKNKEEAILSL